MPQPADVGRVGRKEQAILTAGCTGFLSGIWEGDLRRTGEEGDVSGTSGFSKGCLTALMRKGKYLLDDKSNVINAVAPRGYDTVRDIGQTAELFYHHLGRAFFGARDKGSIELPALQHRCPNSQLQ